MQNYFDMHLSRDELLEMSSLALAHIGDAVYDLLVRSHLCTLGSKTAASLHRKTVRMVSAPAQARAAEKIASTLSEDEATVLRRGRNTKTKFIPKNASRSQYQHATGLECLFGFLYMSGETERINELFGLIVGGEDSNG